MSVTLTLLAAERGKGPFVEAEVLVTLAGNYTQGGVVADLTTLYGQVDPAGRTLDSDVLPIFADVQGMGQLAAGTAPNQYKLATHTDPSNGTPAVALTPATCKLAVYSGVTEAASAVFTDAVLSDRVVMKLVFPSQK